tara:strand:+ start:421 stop:786 length:366 start_codon:yes stop_codon:yes gene_type:complete
MDNIDVIGLLNAGYASPSMSAMTPPPTVNAIPSGLLSSGEAVTAPMNTRGMYNLLGDVPFSVSPGGEVYTPPQFDFFDFSGLSLPTSGPIASLLQTYANNLANNDGISPLGIPNFVQMQLF